MTYTRRTAGPSPLASTAVGKPSTACGVAVLSAAAATAGARTDACTQSSKRNSRSPRKQQRARTLPSGDPPGTPSHAPTTTHTAGRHTDDDDSPRQEDTQMMTTHLDILLPGVLSHHHARVHVSAGGDEKDAALLLWPMGGGGERGEPERRGRGGGGAGRSWRRRAAVVPYTHAGQMVNSSSLEPATRRPEPRLPAHPQESAHVRKTARLQACTHNTMPGSLLAARRSCPSRNTRTHRVQRRAAPPLPPHPTPKLLPAALPGRMCWPCRQRWTP